MGRPRPDIALHLVPTNDVSFPSGHAPDSTVAYLTLALLFATIQSSARARRYGLAVAFAPIALIGASSIYLGVHYPTDILGGWCSGIFCAFAWRMVGRRFTGAIDMTSALHRSERVSST